MMSVLTPAPSSASGPVTTINTTPQDDNITTEELVAFFGETCADGDDVEKASYWLKKIDGYGDNAGSITMVGMRSPLGTGVV